MVRKPDDVVKPPDDPPPPPLLAVLVQASMAMERALLERLRAAGYTDQTIAQGRLFGAIPPEGIRLTDLAQRAQLTKQAVGELVDQMAAAGYVERTADPTDARAKLIRFTDRGWRAVRAALSIFAELEAELEARLGADRVATARQVLEQTPTIVEVGPSA